VWCGVVWCGVVWCGVVWCGVVWCGVVWCGVVLLTFGTVLSEITDVSGCFFTCFLPLVHFHFLFCFLSLVSLRLVVRDSPRDCEERLRPR
jgi:hypothetical protein